MLKFPRASGLPLFIAREVASYALHGALGVTRGPASSATPGPRILFVHGHGGSAGIWKLLEKQLRRAGHERFASFDYSSTGSIDRIAAALARHVRDEVPGELHVIAHSLGGIIARAWLQEHGGRERALSFTTLSSPHRGLGAIGGPARALPVVRELVAGSPLLERLERGGGVLAGLPCLSIVSSRDHFVRPWQNAAFAHARVVPVAHAGHVGVLFSREVARLVAEQVARLP